MRHERQGFDAKFKGESAGIASPSCPQSIPGRTMKIAVLAAVAHLALWGRSPALAIDKNVDTGNDDGRSLADMDIIDGAGDDGRSLADMESMDGAGDDGRPSYTIADDVSSDAEIVARVIDGSRAQPGEYPFYTAVIDEQFGLVNTLVCGGTLKAERVVLSAAHCTDTGAVDKVKVGAYGAPGLGNQGSHSMCQK